MQPIYIFKESVSLLPGNSFFNAECTINSALCIELTLALLVLGVLTDNHDFAVTLDYLALLAHGFYGRSDFHCISSYLLLHVIRPRVTS